MWVESDALWVGKWILTNEASHLPTINESIETSFFSFLQFKIVANRQKNNMYLKIFIVNNLESQDT